VGLRLYADFLEEETVKSHIEHDYSTVTKPLSQVFYGSYVLIDSPEFPELKGRVCLWDNNSRLTPLDNTDDYYTSGKKGFDSFKINATVLRPGDKFTVTVGRN
jgi:hypothetical protein